MLHKISPAAGSECDKCFRGSIDVETTLTLQAYLSQIGDGIEKIASVKLKYTMNS